MADGRRKTKEAEQDLARLLDRHLFISLAAGIYQPPGCPAEGIQKRFLTRVSLVSGSDRDASRRGGLGSDRPADPRAGSAAG